LTDQAMQAMRQEAESAEQAHQTASGPVDCGLVFALGMEAGGLIDLLENRTRSKGEGFVLHVGTVGETRLAIIQSGMGGAAAKKATELILKAYAPKRVISAGYCGALQESFERFDILVANRLVDVASDESVPLFEETSSSTELQWQGEKSQRAYTGTLVSTEKVVQNSEKKKELHDRYDAQGVDMETFSVYRVCREREVPFLSIRIVLDTLHDELPADLEHVLNADSNAEKLGAALGALWRRPSSAKDMYQLKENALLATDRLAGFLSGIVRLPEKESEDGRDGSTS
jgi:adenosylhomocysteine nucleosidase